MLVDKFDDQNARSPLAFEQCGNNGFFAALDINDHEIKSGRNRVAVKYGLERIRSHSHCLRMRSQSRRP